MAKTINVALVGTGFMGKAHSNAYLNVNKFFNLPANVVMHTVVSRSADTGKDMMARWGWQRTTDNLAKVLADPAIDLIDIVTPNNLHAKIAVAAAKAGKAIACEKPLAHTLAGATQMAEAVKKAKVPTFVWFNYRRAPAVSLARQLIDEGRIGQIYHIRATYLQDWIMDPNFPLVWRLRKEVCGSGAHGDLNAHIIDIANYLVGPFESVCGLMKTFIKQRPLPVSGAGRQTLGGSGKGGQKGKVTVDDAALLLAKFANGAVGTFEATRFAKGRKNRNTFEINGSKGSLGFNFERMNELEYFDATEPQHVQGFRTILATDPSHPYIKAWWPGGHIIGYEHGFVNQLADMVTALCSKGRKATFHPDFADALACQRVLTAVERSDKIGKWVKLASVK